MELSRILLGFSCNWSRKVNSKLKLLTDIYTSLAFNMIYFKMIGTISEEKANQMAI